MTQEDVLGASTEHWLSTTPLHKSGLCVFIGTSFQCTSKLIKEQGTGLFKGSSYRTPIRNKCAQCIFYADTIEQYEDSSRAVGTTLPANGRPG